MSEQPIHLQQKGETPREWAKRTGAYIDPEEIDKIVEEAEDDV